MTKTKKYRFNVSNGKYTFYPTIEGVGRFDVEERMKMLYKDSKRIVFMGEVRDQCVFSILPIQIHKILINIYKLCQKTQNKLVKINTKNYKVN